MRPRTVIRIKHPLQGHSVFYGSFMTFFSKQTVKVSDFNEDIGEAKADVDRRD